MPRPAATAPASNATAHQEFTAFAWLHYQWLFAQLKCVQAARMSMRLWLLALAKRGLPTTTI